ncbi:hypothetical protein B0T17DRAFT_546885 [Bombardia bombarda]|uniref:Uncharacterized protein n=1 Tax=Bombardia bombarda TaxID=252184 RepID=A0AA39TQH2_9PEZI|nr:hypothetical protein B0T17DRAFT_546885 [Bombardia bombarda]
MTAVTCGVWCVVCGCSLLLLLSLYSYRSFALIIFLSHLTGSFLSLLRHAECFLMSSFMYLLLCFSFSLGYLFFTCS